MTERLGCLGGLLSLPLRLLSLGRGHRRIAQRAAPPSGLLPAERTTVQRARSAATQCRTILYGAGSIDPAVLDQVSGSVDALLDRIDALAGRIASARGWLISHDLERSRQELVELELSDQGSVVDRMRSIKALKEQVHHASAVQAGLPGLAAKLTAATHRLEALAARLTAEQLDAAALVAEIGEQEATVGRAVEAWRATVDEISGL